MKYLLLLLAFALSSSLSFSQNNTLTYLGNSGKETLYDVMQLSDGTFLACGYADNLDWIDNSIPRTELTYPGNIPNGLGTNRYGILLHFSKDLQTLERVVHFPRGAVEDIRFIKSTNLPYTPTGDLYISCNTSDNDNNNGGYILGMLNGNFVNSLPTGLNWITVVWAKSGPKDYHPWDVNSKGEVYYISGEAHGYDWSAMYCLNAQGIRKVVPNWRTHWLVNGSEWKGTPASSYPGGIDSVKYSGIALKRWGRCELRSWTWSEFNAIIPDGNGGFKKGTWPADFFYQTPCDPANPTEVSPGYNGYSPESCCPVYGGSCVAIDKRNDHVYLGMNMKSYFVAGSSPDFEPAVVAMDETGTLKWWSRLYHEITPAGDTIESLPDQYVDALAIDYKNNRLVVGARAHGNNVENLWEGNTIASDPAAYGFQNRFTGTNGNIHESWIGKLNLTDGTLTASTYMAELAEGTGGLGSPHPDPNLAGWPDLNTGWPDVNTTRMAKNNLKVSSNGDVAIIALGRRTVTTATAWQKMLSPYSSGQGAWNSFVRLYDEKLRIPKYSSLVVGVWDTTNQSGGGNTELFGVYKTDKGVVCVGRQNATNAIPAGNPIPVVSVPSWGSQSPENESAILAYFEDPKMFEPGDGPAGQTSEEIKNTSGFLSILPNPCATTVSIQYKNQHEILTRMDVFSANGSRMLSVKNPAATIDVSSLSNGIYSVQLTLSSGTILNRKLVVLH